MAKVIIIGGGFAGLSAATALVEQGHHVSVFEGRQTLGGRAYSFIDPKTGDVVDNGQHLFMGCYDEMQVFLKRIGTLSKLFFQPNLEVEFAGADGAKAGLHCLPLPAPWHLLSGLFRLASLSWGDRFRLLRMRQALKEAAKNPDALNNMTVSQWLTRWGQSERSQRNLWDLIAIAALNEDPSIAAAAPFATVLAQAFFEGRKSSRLGIATVGLSDLYVGAARSYIETHGGEIFLKAPVERILIKNKRVEGIQLREGRQVSADWVISAVPPPAFIKMLDPQSAADPVFQKLAKLKPAPIISIHLWFDRMISPRLFVGLMGTQIQWFFNKSAILHATKSQEGYISLVISGAHKFVDWSETRLLAMATEELKRLFPEAREASLSRYLVIKEHQATLSPEVGSEEFRPGYESPYARLLIAGDWVKTGLPATIESACLSGHACAKIISSGGESITMTSGSSPVKIQPSTLGNDEKEQTVGVAHA